ncbi:wHTH domain-containing protein [Streptomyces hirsutus]|uniref:wHTH domain-containing protein n=1 Tax=Streptomyces hirsutus TaxID=35620 RepID=UPI00364A5B2C
MPHPPVPLDDHDRRIISHELNAEAPWLDPEEPVTLGHVLRAAASRHGDPGAIGSRLAELGYRVPSSEQLASVTDDDRKLVSRDIDGSGPWIRAGNVASLRGHVLAAARRLGRPAAEIAARLTELGHPAPAPDSFPERVLDEDRDLITHPDRTGPGRWITDGTLVTLGHVIAVLQRMGKLTRVPQQTVFAIDAACERFTQLGYRVAPGAAEATVDDVVLASVGLDGCTPWLPARDEPVPLHHVLRFAQAHDRDPNEVVARLGRLGYHRLPEGPLAGSVEREDIGLLGHGWEGGTSKSWLAQDDLAWFSHLVAVGVETGKAPAEIADRLRALGYTVPEQELPAKVSESDLPLISGRALTAAGPWLSRTDSVPVGHVLYSAHARGTSVASVLARLAELGHTRLPDVPDRHVTEDDLRLISERGDGDAPVLGDTVPYGRVVRAAAVSGTGPHEIAVRYRELGYTDVVLPDGPLPESVAERDADLITTDTGWLAPGEAVPLPYVVRRAHAEGVGPAAIARRLRALGFHQVPAPLPETPHPGDLVMISKNAEPGGPYLPSTGMAARHVLRAADVVGVSPHDIAVRLVALGYTLEFTPHPDDAVIVSENADGRAPWQYWTAGPGHVLLVAKVLDRTPEEINDRRGELGYEQRKLPDAGGFEEEDILLLSENLDARGPWIRWGGTPSLKHVLRAARATGRSPQETGQRLTLLGHEVHVPPVLDVRDSDLLEAVPQLGKSMDLAEILAVASRTGRSPAEVAARLRELDIEVPDLDYPTRRPALTPPRLP